MTGRRWWCVGLLVWAGLAAAGGAPVAAPRIESTMLVEGSVEIDAGGSVVAFQVERRERLGTEVAGLIDQAVSQWRFQPPVLPSGKTRARAAMTLRLVARKLDDGAVLVAIQSATFGRSASEESPRARRMDQPSYPQRPWRQGVSGTVYLVVLIGRDGRVVDAAAEQVNLRTLASEPEMQAWRAEFAEAAIRAARRWTFVPPRSGPGVDAAGWAVRAPVSFELSRADEPDRYAWSAYVPGPRMPLPWANGEGDAGSDAVVAGDVHVADPSFRLLTALDGT